MLEHKQAFTVVEHPGEVPPLDGLCYRDVRRELSIERRGQLLEERATKCILRGCNLHPTRWQTRFPRSNTHPHSGASLRVPGGLQMVASSRRTELNGILARFQTRQLFISDTLLQEDIALEETADGIWSVYVYDVLLARLDERDFRLYA